MTVWLWFGEADFGGPANDARIFDGVPKEPQKSPDGTESTGQNSKHHQKIGSELQKMHWPAGRE
jgi:hypothetical protein